MTSRRHTKSLIPIAPAPLALGALGGFTLGAVVGGMVGGASGIALGAAIALIWTTVAHLRVDPSASTAEEKAGKSERPTES